MPGTVADATVPPASVGNPRPSRVSTMRTGSTEEYSPDVAAGAEVEVT